jgi:hypothetical protein
MGSWMFKLPSRFRHIESPLKQARAIPNRQLLQKVGFGEKDSLHTWWGIVAGFNAFALAAHIDISYSDIWIDLEVVRHTWSYEQK